MGRNRIALFFAEQMLREIAGRPAVGAALHRIALPLLKVSRPVGYMYPPARDAARRFFRQTTPKEWGRGWARP